jgi:GTPase
VFIDEVKIKVISWRGWDGLVSWRREKYIPKWGPRGGNAWNGWSVYLLTDENLNTLSEYRHKKVLAAIKWEWGWTQDCHWANAPDLILKVPVWTIVKDADTMEIIADLSENNVKLLVAKWWKWGFWNSHFCSSTRQAPAFAELGDVVEEKDLHLELKLVADIWIIGVPSAWKSTLIWNVTNVKPKIGDYPFTTLTPNLWVLDHKWKSLVLEDVPWLIPGASEWKWLWIEFLKHIERTWVLLHLLDMYRMDQVFDDYMNIRKELELFSPDLADKEEIVVFSKADLLDKEMKDYILSEFNKKFTKKVFIISAVTGEWIDKLIDYLIDNYSKDVELEEKLEEIKEIKLYDLKENINPKAVEVKYLWDFKFEAKGVRLEQIIRMTDFENKEALLRVYDVLDKLWVMRIIEPELKKILEETWMDNSFFFETWEWEEEPEWVNPKVVVSWREIALDKLKYKL